MDPQNNQGQQDNGANPPQGTPQGGQNPPTPPVPPVSPTPPAPPQGGSAQGQGSTQQDPNTSVPPQGAVPPVPPQGVPQQQGGQQVPPPQGTFPPGFPPQGMPQQQGGQQVPPPQGAAVPPGFPPQGMPPQQGGQQMPQGAYPQPGMQPQGQGFPPQGMPPAEPEDTTPANFQLGTKLPAKLNVACPANELNFDEEYFIRLLASSISLSKDEKKRIIESIPKLKQAQIDELIRIFEEEKQKFAALSKKHVPQLEKLAEQHFKEWMDLETEFFQEDKKQEDTSKADEIRKQLGL